MSEGHESVLLDPETEAERLWRGARDAYRAAAKSIVGLSEALDLGVRVVEIMTAKCLEPVRDKFPTTVAKLLEPLPPEVDPTRDFLHPPKSLRFVDVLDMLSEDDLPCISPQLHHGWEDMAASCRRSRARTKKLTGIALTAEQRDALMLIGAYRNRIFFLPPPVRIVPGDLLRVFPVLAEVAERLFAAARSSTS